MASQTEVPAAGEFIFSESPGTYSRENVVIAATSGVIPAGRLLGKITAGGKYDNFDTGQANGTQTCTGILYAEVDATTADQPAVMIVRDCEVVSARVTAETAGHKAAGVTTLTAAGIIFR